MTPEQLLREGLAVYGLPADAAAIEGLEEFSRRLLERNQVMNLRRPSPIPATWRRCTCWIVRTY